jgi:hypothetical protein
MMAVEQNQRYPNECSLSHSKAVACALGVSCFSLVRSSNALVASFLALLLTWLSQERKEAGGGERTEITGDRDIPN